MFVFFLISYEYSLHVKDIMVFVIGVSNIFKYLLIVSNRIVFQSSIWPFEFKDIPSQHSIMARVSTCHHSFLATCFLETIFSVKI